ncbi:hypothetical protein TSPI_06332 [Trichinella spiralis]|uniref:Uncharacterized protein n=1 Tax=Trichinella spiralis TaxID=6334 RepID=A0ABR3KVK6_TRISP
MKESNSCCSECSDFIRYIRCVQQILVVIHFWQMKNQSFTYCYRKSNSGWHEWLVRLRYCAASTLCNLVTWHQLTLFVYCFQRGRKWTPSSWFASRSTIFIGRPHKSAIVVAVA